MIKCDECGKEFKTTQALGGHMRFVHGIRKDKQATLFPPKRFITDDNFGESMMKVLDTPMGHKFIEAIAKEICNRSGLEK